MKTTWQGAYTVRVYVGEAKIVLGDGSMHSYICSALSLGIYCKGMRSVAPVAQLATS